MARASAVNSLSIWSSAVGRGRRKPRGSRSPSRYPHCRKALKTRSRSELTWFEEVSTTAAPAAPLEDLDVGAIGSSTRITDAPRLAGDSGRGDPLTQGSLRDTG